MPAPLRPTWGKSHRPNPLAGGRAPTWWERTMVHRTAWLNGLRRDCAWIETLSAMRVRLRDGPLLGSGLAALTAQGPRPGEPLPQVAQPGRAPGPTHPRVREPAQPSPPRSPGEARPADQMPGKAPSRRSALPPLQQEPTASHAALARLAGGAVPDVERSSAFHQQAGETLEPGTSASPQISQEAGDHRDWLHQVAQRVTHSLRQDGPDRSPGRASLDPPEAGEGPPVAELWAKPLDGLPASADLLTRLAGAPVADADRPGREASRWEVGRPAASSDWLARPAGVPGADNDGSAYKAPIEPLSGRAPVIPPRNQLTTQTTKDHYLWQTGELAPTEGTPAAAIPPSTSRREDIGGGLASPTRIAPPKAASLLPPLLPPQVASGPPSPVTAAIVQQDGRQEEATEEDLSALAAKVKRILDEEARRHGIDV